MWYRVSTKKPTPYVPPTWADGTDEEIVEALQKHYAGEIDLTDYWSVGDERTVSLSAMSATGVGESHTAQNVVFVLTNVGGKTLSDGVTECVFQVDQKNSLKEIGYIDSDTYISWEYTDRRTWCNSVYYNSIPSTLRSIFKSFKNTCASGFKTTTISTVDDYFSLRSAIEVFGTNNNRWIAGEGSQVTWYGTTANQVKQVNGSNSSWWTRSLMPYNYNNANGYYNYIYDFIYSVTGGKLENENLGIAPFGVI